MFLDDIRFTLFRFWLESETSRDGAVKQREKKAMDNGEILVGAGMPIEDTGSDSVVAQMRRLIELRQQVEMADEHLSRLRTQASELEAQLFDRMVDEGIQRVNVDGRTIYRHTAIRASIKADSRPQALEALRELGLGVLIKSEPTVHSATIAAKVREWIETDGKVPAEIEPFLSVHEAHSVRVLST